MAIDRDLEQMEQVRDQQDGPSEPGQTSGADSNDGAQGAEGTVARQEYERSVKERDSLLDRLARTQAEFDNYRKRSAKEQSDFREYAVADTIKNFLPIIDNFDLALRAQKADAGDSALRSGIELIRKQMEDVLSRLGVQVVAAQGQTFDPRVHEAIEMVESNEHPDHQVIEELQHGYKLKDRLLRPAMVRVATNPNKK
jgi:molecular chaperone GrpE